MRSLLSSLLWRSWELKRWQILDWNTRISHGPTLEAPFSSILDPKPASSLHGSLSYCRGKFQFREFQGWLLTKEHTWSTDHMECLLTKCVWDVEHGRMKRQGERCLLVLRWVVGVLCLANAQADGPTGKQPRRRSGSSLAEAEHARNRSSLQISSSGKLFGDPPEGGMVGRCCASCLRRCQSQDHIGWPFSASHRCSLQKIYLYHTCQNHQRSMLISYMQVSNYVKDI